jgi:hypothetical protein
MDEKTQAFLKEILEALEVNQQVDWLHADPNYEFSNLAEQVREYLEKGEENEVVK